MTIPAAVMAQNQYPDDQSQDQYSKPSPNVAMQDEQDAVPFDVAEEPMAEPPSLTGAFDQSRNVGDHETSLGRGLSHHHHTQIGFEGGEGVIGNLGPRRRNARDQSGLAHVRISHQSHIRQQLQLQAKDSLLSGMAVLVFAHRSSPCHVQITRINGTAADTEQCINQ